MGEIVPFAQKLRVLQGDLERYEDRLQQVLPTNMDPARFVAVVHNQVQRTPQLLDCQRGTVVGCVVQAAELGLEFGAKSHAHLIPRRIKGQLRCTLLIDYRGLVHLAMQGGGVRAVWAHVVRKGDQFDFQLGDNPSVRHVPDLMSEPAGDDSDVVAAYAVLELANGRKLLEVIPRWELDKVRNSAQASQSGPWASWFGRMARKTALKRVCNLPAATGSSELSQALQVDDAQELGRASPVQAQVEDEIQRVGGHAGASWAEDAQPAQPAPKTDEGRTGDPGASDGHADQSADQGAKAPWWEQDAKAGSKLALAQACFQTLKALAETAGPDAGMPGTYLGENWAGMLPVDLNSLTKAELSQLHGHALTRLEDVERDQDELPQQDGGAS